MKRIFYGWWLVIALAVTETVSYGVLLYNTTVFITPMMAELGWSRAAITGAVSLSLLVSALVGSLIGRWLDRHGPRGLMTLGTLLTVGLVLAWSQVQDVRAYYLIWFGIGFAKAMVFYEPAFWTVANWFVRYRRRALTLLTFIAGFSFVIFAPLANALISAQGWRDALVTLAILHAAVTLPIHLLVLRRRPADLGLLPDGETMRDGVAASAAPVSGPTFKEVVRRPAFWWLTSAFALNGVGSAVIILYLVPYLRDGGYDPAFAAWAAGLIGLASLPGRLIFTPAGERWSPGGIAALIFATQAVGLFLLIIAGSEMGVLLFVAVFSLGYGALTPARAALVAEHFGWRAYGSVNGLLVLIATVSGAAALVGAGAAYDAFDSFIPVLWALVILSMLAVGAMLMVKGLPVSGSRLPVKDNEPSATARSTNY
jgi:MFS family permease